MYYYPKLPTKLHNLFNMYKYLVYYCVKKIQKYKLFRQLYYSVL